jgi:uncharacterized membrane protein
MDEVSEQTKIATFYRHFRTSRSFLAILVTFIGIWMSLHFTRGFDPDWGGLNLVLSIEASIGMALFMLVADRQDKFQQRQLRYMLHVIEAVHALLEEQAAALRVRTHDGDDG